MEIFSATKLVNDGTTVARQELDNKKVLTNKMEEEKSNTDKDKEQKKLSPETKDDLVKKLNEELSKHEKNLEFSFDDDIKQMVITIKRKDNGEVVRTIPTEEAIEMAKQTKEMAGILIDKNV